MAFVSLLDVFNAFHALAERVRGMFGLREGLPQHVAVATVRVMPRPARRPLRVVHSAQGRMVISGRLADVCAELDRLAALEMDRRPGGVQAFAPTR